MKIILFLLSALFLASIAWLLSTREPVPRVPVAWVDPDPVSRGKYLVKLGGCTDCHTPKIMTDKGPVDDSRRLFAGHPSDVILQPAGLDPKNPWGAATAGMTAWSGPWGVSYASNLTPDVETGIGSWSEREFIDTFRTGKHRGSGREILPPMPWQPLSEAREEDIAAIFAYLKSLPAVSNKVPSPMAPVIATR